MLTWSFGCTARPRRALARRAITSLAFMLVLVPEPVWNTSTGKCASWRPSATSAAAATMAAATSASSRPSSALAVAAALLISASARMNPRGIGRPLIGKFSTARCVWAPHSAQAGTFSSPMLSRSMRKSVEDMVAPEARSVGLGYDANSSIRRSTSPHATRPARRAVPDRRPLRPRHRAPAPASLRGRAGARAHPHRGAVAVAARGPRRADACGRSAARRRRSRAVARALAAEPPAVGRRRGQGDRGAHQPRREGGRILGARPAAGQRVPTRRRSSWSISVARPKTSTTSPTRACCRPGAPRCWARCNR